MTREHRQIIHEHQAIYVVPRGESTIVARAATPGTVRFSPLGGPIPVIGRNEPASTERQAKPAVKLDSATAMQVRAARARLNLLMA